MAILFVQKISIPTEMEPFSSSKSLDEKLGIDWRFVSFAFLYTTSFPSPNYNDYQSKVLHVLQSHESKRNSFAPDLLYA